jgi:hypothetical protein
MSSEAQPQLDLNFLVLGDDPSYIFPIEIAESKTVGSPRGTWDQYMLHRVGGGVP